MKSNESPPKRVCIHITLYKQKVLGEEYIIVMDERGKKTYKQPHNKFVCSVCLNTSMDDKNSECCKKIANNCPLCQKNCEYHVNPQRRDKEKVVAEKEKQNKVKNVQPETINVAQGLSLLNEVLTVFQNKKVDINKEINREKVKSGLLKDVAVSTEDHDVNKGKKDEGDEKNIKDRSRLTINTFQYSIDETKKPEIGKFTIVNSSQPDYIKKSQISIDLIKHKSSSIPQMKLEELKYSLKAKTRSKDAIEEVNRMFATVKKSGKTTDSNRPMVRSGPRVLPVVKNNPPDNKKEIGVDCKERFSCKCCQTCMSSGDSLSMKPECCRDSNKDKCYNMLCCHYENKRLRQGGMLMCEHCRTLNDDHFCHHEYVDDSSC